MLSWVGLGVIFLIVTWAITEAFIAYSKGRDFARAWTLILIANVLSAALSLISILNQQ